MRSRMSDLIIHHAYQGYLVSIMATLKELHGGYRNAERFVAGLGHF
jgi:hypothetical protein